MDGLPWCDAASSITCFIPPRPIFSSRALPVSLACTYPFHMYTTLALVNHQHWTRSSRLLCLSPTPMPENPCKLCLVPYRLLLRHNSSTQVQAGTGAPCMTKTRSCSYRASPSEVSFPSLDLFLFLFPFLPGVRSWFVLVPCWQ